MRSKRSYPALYAPFIWASFMVAVFGGFLLASYLALNMGSGLWPGRFLIEHIQLHGHLQLLGWMGLLLIGVSLYVLPRLTSSPIYIRNSRRWIFVTLILGIGTRIGVVIALVLAIGSRIWISYLMFAGMILETVGMVLYLSTVMRCVLDRKTDKNDLNRLGPYLFAMFSGWCFLAIGTTVGGISLIGSDSIILNPLWNDLLIESFVRLTLIPAVFGFGVKMLPVFLGLHAPLWPVRKVGLLLVVSTYLYLCGKLCRILVPDQVVFGYLSAVGQLGIALAVLGFTWLLDALLFRVLPERVALKVYRSDAHLQRGRYGDKGEFGRFELFIITGFAWISLVALLEGANGISILLGVPEMVSAVTLRHALLLGGLTHLVLGVSHRLLPNLLGWAQVAPMLTGVSFTLMLVASLCRVFPLLLADFGLTMPTGFFAFSGVFGVAGIGLAFFNICGRKLLRCLEKLNCTDSDLI